MLANIFSNIGLTEGQKASFSLEQEFLPNSYKNIMTEKRAQFKDSQFEDSRFEFWVADRSQLAKTVMCTFPAQQNWFSVAPWIFNNSLVNDSVQFGLVNCYNLQI